MKNTEFKKGDNVLSNSKWNNGKAGIVHAVYPYGVSVNFGDNINPSYQVFHFKPSHHMQTNINDLEIIPPLQIETDNELLATNDPELIKQGVPELTPADSTNEVKAVQVEPLEACSKSLNKSELHELALKCTGIDDFESANHTHKMEVIAFKKGYYFANKSLNEAVELSEAVKELLQVKEWKDVHGKDELYLKAQPIAWANLKTAYDIFLSQFKQ